MDISHLAEDIKEGDIFVVIRGKSFDNIREVEEAIRRGAKLIITPEKLEFDIEQIVSEDTRKTAEEWAKRLYNLEGLKIVGITGTNGKTTTSFLIREILNLCAGKTALIGTIVWDDLNDIKTSKLTTPERFYILRILGRAKRAGGKFAVMEVSSIGLDQGRVDGIRFSVGVFTNLSRDHLDYHGSMENYLNAKLKLFKMLESDAFAVINSDDPYADEFIRSTKAKVITYGKNGDYLFKILEHSVEGMVLNINGRVFECGLLGEYNAYNVAAAYAVSKIFGISDDCIRKALKEFKGVRGRLERVFSGDFHVFVDYAHTPDAMEKVLKELRRFSNRLIVVFGAGGNRDEGKRPIMGEVAEKFADIIVLTSDNPRFEDPERIIDDIARGISTKGYYRVPDRREAISLALSIAGKGDIVAILGKGHENYQEINGFRYPFDDTEVVREVLNVRRSSDRRWNSGTLDSPES